MGQGWLFARPMPADRFEAWLREHATESASVAG
jgi:sensor c-di-GMP phosphodiesterase-like protein